MLTPDPHQIGLDLNHLRELPLGGSFFIYKSSNFTPQSQLVIVQYKYEALFICARIDIVMVYHGNSYKAALEWFR